MSPSTSFKTRTLNFFRKVFVNTIFEELLVKYSQGKSPNSFISKLLPSHYLYKKGSMRLVTRHDINYRLDISDLVDWYLYFGLQELAHNNLYALCRKDSIIIDVGTNIGAVLMQMSKIAQNGFVFGFEPDPQNFKTCQRNISLNKLENVKVYNMALGNENKMVKLLVVDEFNRGMNKISPDGGDVGKDVLITSLDQFVSENFIKKIDLIKIDTEGFELKVLEGASNTIAKFKPTLFIELDDENLKEQGSSAQALVNYLQVKNYKLRRADNNETINNEADFRNCHFDIIGINED